MSKPSSSEYRTQFSYSTIYAFRGISISTPFDMLIRMDLVSLLLWRRRGRRSTFASLPPTTTAWVKGDWLRSLFCHLVSSGVSSDSAGSGNLDSSTAVAFVDGADCWARRRYGPASKAPAVRIEFLFVGRVVIRFQVGDVRPVNRGLLCSSLPQEWLHHTRKHLTCLDRGQRSTVGHTPQGWSEQPANYHGNCSEIHRIHQIILTCPRRRAQPQQPAPNRAS